MGKHVIFLGAGASQTSGYPLAVDLRKKWFASVDTLRDQFTQSIVRVGPPDSASLLKDFGLWAERNRHALELFRNGCFGTIDEFCHLIQSSRADDVLSLKKVMRLILGLNNPEADYIKSDYYSFIQRLFAGDLRTLRDDVVIVSYNYDVYLEWLLRRAFRTRANAYHTNPIRSADPFIKADAKITSGFSGGQQGLKEITDGDGFCILKLHGMIAWPEVNEATGSSVELGISYTRIFEPGLAARLRDLVSQTHGQSEPPIVFPWEIMNDKRVFNDREFPLKDSGRNQLLKASGQLADPEPLAIFQGVWARARKEVQAADKVSFVGLSLHQFLDTGMKYLFEGKTGTVKLVVTDADSPIESGEYRTLESIAPTSPPARMLAFLQEYCENLICNVSATVTNAKGDQFDTNKNTSSVRIRRKFDDFIVKEMD